MAQPSSAIARTCRLAVLFVALAGALTALSASASATEQPAEADRGEPIISYRSADEPAATTSAASHEPLTVIVDEAVVPAALATPETAEPRRLAPLGRTDKSSAGLSAKGLPASLSVQKMLLTSGAGLAIVVGLLLACVWLVRREGPRSSDMLPPEAFAVLGKAPLFGQTVGHLIRLGNKLVLVAATADGIQPLVEVTDHEEVNRLAGLCLAKQPHSSAAEFQQVLRSLAQEPAKGFLGR